jgi:hypothetical protein
MFRHERGAVGEQISKSSAVRLKKKWAVAAA